MPPLVALVVWAPATVFFAALGLAVARGLAAGQPPRIAPIVDPMGALVTAAYSLGGAGVGLGLAWLALPRDDGRALARAAALWLGVTAMLLGTRRVSGWPLLVAAVVALGIGLDVLRRLLVALARAGGRPPSAARRG